MIEYSATAALGRYAEEHDEYSSALRGILGWMTELIWTPGPEADERRGRVFPRMLSEPRGFLDSLGLGPLVQTTTRRGGSCWASTKPPDYFGFVRTELML
jgi:hypothetical protein